MKYEKIVEGRFLSRPNRFIAHVEIEGRKETVHVKNTGRCRELLVPGACVFLSDETGAAATAEATAEAAAIPAIKGGRKTRYDLVAVKKRDRIVNMDSQAPNAAVGEWLAGAGLFQDIEEIKPEYTYGESRFDFYVKTADAKVLIEVKGVTLEEADVVSFPDAPSERAVRHVNELIAARQAGYETYLLFVIQMRNVSFFMPNARQHAAFAESLRRAAGAGVHVLAYDSRVTPEGMTVGDPVPVLLEYAWEYPLCIAPLLAWYDAGHRALPWRERPQGYSVWISEIMLQQTRVEAVKPYFARFMEALPDVASLAAVEEEKLLKLWEGLGYYNRARNLKKAAIQIMEKCGGRMPARYEDLITLPGIGSYTAGAIASIAFGQAVPAVDGNVLRILSRLTADGADISKEAIKKETEQKLKAVMPKDRPGDFNQALMELGATVCIPTGQPKCDVCPWNTICRAHLAGREEEYPKKAPKKGRVVEKKTILIIQDEEKSALCKRPESGLLAGMYEFPGLPGHVSRERVLAYLEAMGLKALRIRSLPPAKHIFTHREWHMEGYLIRVDELSSDKTEVVRAGWIFAESREAEEKYPLPSAFAPYAGYLKIRQGRSALKEQAATQKTRI